MFHHPPLELARCGGPSRAFKEPFMKSYKTMATAFVLIATATGAGAADDVYRPDSRNGPAVEEPLPWRGSTKDNGYPVPQPPPQSDYQPPRRPTVARECLSTVGLRDALNSQGWHAFSDVERRDSVAYMSARSDRGRRFDLQVDNCTGDVIEANPVIYTEAPRTYYYEERPSVGVYIGGGGGHHRYYRGHGRW
jgi:hypothetical protein